MADLVFVVIIVTFFALCVVYVKWCDRIIGPDEFGVTRTEHESPYVATDSAFGEATSAAG